MDLHSLLLCPISLELMDDPVTVHESGITYDRESLSESLRRYPDLEPSTGQRFGHPLHFTANVTILQIVELVHLDAQLPRRLSASTTTKESLEATVKSLLLCPISLEVMEDPVLMHESGIVYDRKSLCLALLARPNLEPQTGQICTHPLEFTSCIVMRSIIAHLYGEAQLQRHDDRLFHKLYRTRRTDATVPTTGPAVHTTTSNEARNRRNPPPSASFEEDSDSTGTSYHSPRPDPPGSAEIPRGSDDSGHAPAAGVSPRQPESRNAGNQPNPPPADPPAAQHAAAPARNKNSRGCTIVIVVVVVVFVFYFVIHAANSSSIPRVVTTRAVSTRTKTQSNLVFHSPPLQMYDQRTDDRDGASTGTPLLSDSQGTGYCRQHWTPGLESICEMELCIG